MYQDTLDLREFPRIKTFHRFFLNNEYICNFLNLNERNFLAKINVRKELINIAICESCNIFPPRKL